MGGEGHSERGQALRSDADQYRALARQHLAYARHQHGAQNGACAHGCQQHRERARTAAGGCAMVQALGCEWQQRHDGGGLQKVADGAQQHGMHARRLFDELQAHAHGRAQALAAQRVVGLLALPAQQHKARDDGQRRIQHKHPGAAQAGNDGARHQRADDARGIHGHAVERHGKRQMVLGHQLGNQRRKHRPAHGQTDAVGKHQGQQQIGCELARQHRQAQQQRHGSHPELGNDEIAAPVQNIGQRAAGQGQQHDGQGGGRLHQRHQHGRCGQRCHQPGGCHIVHPHADIGRHPDQPQHAESGCGQRRPDAGRGRCGLRPAAAHTGGVFQQLALRGETRL